VEGCLRPRGEVARRRASGETMARARLRALDDGYDRHVSLPRRWGAAGWIGWSRAARLFSANAGTHA